MHEKPISGKFLFDIFKKKINLCISNYPNLMIYSKNNDDVFSFERKTISDTINMIKLCNFS